MTTRFSSRIGRAAAALIVSMSALAWAQNGAPGKGPGPGGSLSWDTAPLTAEEAKTLVFMREEEKLARDVYQKLYEKWNLVVFRNIAESEDQHFKVVGDMLARHKIADPAADMAPGEFRDARLAALYEELIAKGMASVNDALEVGIQIEKADIADLEEAIKQTTRLELKRLYTNLMTASFNHLEAFETNLESACPVCPWK